MPLFVAHHRHSPESCSASAIGAQLLSRVSAAAAASYGVTIEAEALIDGEHRLLLIVDAVDREAVEQFLAFLADHGDMQVLPASTAEEAVERGSCCGSALQPQVSVAKGMTVDQNFDKQGGR
jgi:hypothetical protein